ncbi:larval cuticle protein LCP-17-like [Teleopsis dalmanni]|uniref:larval cuticle protein LCP-17-like n=1 Tax=Teleopsis dalmanni TaxID=139649 RepID=UPI0018CF0C44|nr:larval cuticle protein LCP-17-like [Teleopsis dalmanni]XP_037930294.1 larval cuticle protein LCP-17-like [Teleopsis dalmanni]XP_037931549.1 larval cuticle protein LCP-17-like [Teleopsis dalmanni]
MFKIILITVTLVTLVSAGGNPEDVHATIIKYENELNPDGSYNFEYATSNQIQALESGVGSSYASGSYAYLSPEGQPIQLQYTADENGYQPIGEHLPTPPPIPDYILKSLRYIEQHPFDKIVLTKK